MAVKIMDTSNLDNHKIKFLVFGLAGSGKTSLIPTLPNPFVISAEGGLLSIRKHNVKFTTISSVEELREVYEWLKSSTEAKGFDSVAIDSFSEVAEVVLSNEKKNSKDARLAYGEMQDVVTRLVRSFRDLPLHVYFSAKAERIQDDSGSLLYVPSMPGNKVGQALPYFFDEVLAMRIMKNKDGEDVRVLQTSSDNHYTAKDRSGALDKWERPDLGAIIQKIRGEQ